MTTADDFRRIALTFEGAEERAHMGAVDFRVGGRIFATLASQAQGYGNLVLTPERCRHCSWRRRQSCSSRSRAVGDGWA